MIFIQNKYSQWYYNIINRAKLRVLSNDIETENHHIVPECFFINRKRKGPKGWIEGNPDSPDNKVDLTLHEHLVCHLLLPKFTTGAAKHRMDLAAFMLTKISNGQKRYKITGRWYAILKENMARAKRLPRGNYTKEHGDNISKAKKGIPMEEAQKILLSNIKKNIPWSDVRKNASKHLMTPYGVFYSISEAERQIGVGKGVVRYRMKIQPDKYYFI